MGKLLRRIRQQRGLSLSEAAAEIGVSESYLSRLETDASGETVPSLEVAARIEAWTNKRIRAAAWIKLAPPATEASQCA